MSKVSKELEIEFIETPLKKNQTNKQTKKEEVTDMNKQEYNKAKAHHKGEIKKLKAQRKQLKHDIKRHKLLIKQAKLTYKLTKGE